MCAYRTRGDLGQSCACEEGFCLWETYAFAISTRRYIRFICTCVYVVAAAVVVACVLREIESVCARVEHVVMLVNLVYTHKHVYCF